MLNIFWLAVIFLCFFESHSSINAYVGCFCVGNIPVVPHWLCGACGASLVVWDLWCLIGCVGHVVPHWLS